MTKMILAVVLGLSFSSVSFAEGDGPCMKDKAALCANVDGGGGRIMKCLRENEAKLSVECKGHVNIMKAHRKDVRVACKADAETLCAKAKGPKNKMKCMHENKDKLSEGCKSEIEEMKDARNSH